MQEQIGNEYLSLKISSLGAELQSVYDLQRQAEYLWQGKASWWPRRAPVLFPIVGRLNNNTYLYEGREYSLSQHGFARDGNFKLTDKSPSHVQFVLKNDRVSSSRYPFLFELYIAYRLKDKEVIVTYEVRNPDVKPLYFSIGGHPGFNCPLNPGEQLSDYYLEFEKEEPMNRMLLEDGLFTGALEKIRTDGNKIPLSEALFNQDALVFENLSSGFVNLKSNKSDYDLKFSFQEFKWLGIWQKPGAPFICIEPWCGRADDVRYKGPLTEKPGIEKLEGGGWFARSYSFCFA